MSLEAPADLFAEARRRTSWALIAIGAALAVAVGTEIAAHRLVVSSSAARISLLALQLSALAAIVAVVLVLVRGVLERTASLNLALSGSNAVLWRLYPAEDRIEFIAGDPSAIGATGDPSQSFEALRQLADHRDRDSQRIELERALKAGTPLRYSYRALLPSRGTRQIAVRALPTQDERGRRCLVGVSWDETETHASALRAERASRLYATLGAVYRATRAADTTEHLYEQACHAAVEAGGFPLVWLGIADEETETVRVVARAGRAQAYAAGLKVGMDRSATGKGPVGQALRSGQPSWSNEVMGDPDMAPWHERAAQFGLESAAAIPFRIPGGGRGVLGVYGEAAGLFSTEERLLLARLGDDLSASIERLRSREQQRHQRELLSAIIASAPIAILSLDAEGNVSEIWNAAAEQMLGWTREEAIGVHMPFVPPERRSESAELRRRVLEGEVLHGITVRRRRRDGEIRDMLVFAAPLHDVRGRATGILGIMVDQTEEVRARTAMRASEERFRRLSEQAADVVYRFRIHPEHRIEYLNPAIEQVLGYQPDELLDDPEAIWTILSPEERETFAAIMADPEQVEGQRLELRWRHRDGRTVWVEHLGNVIRDADGQVVALEGIARDVTERRHFEEELARLSRVVEQTSESVIVTDPTGNIVYVNPAFERLTGWKRAEVLGRNPRMLSSGQQSREFYANMWATITSGQTWSGRVTNRRKDGTFYTADILISPVRDAGGNVIQFVGMQRDITRQRDLEDQLRQSQKMEALGQLTGGIAHDFNNLLTIILSNAALLADAVVDRPDLVRDVQAIRTAAGRGARVVRQLMQFGRRERLDPVPMDLGSAVDELVATVGRVLPENIRVSVDIQENLPGALADATAVEQILLNLATNARDAMPDGGVLAFTVVRRAGTDDDPVPEWVVVGVRDTGTGMSREVVARVFEPFYTTKPAGKGTGLGLAMVYGLMEQHGGRVTIYSEPGLGTTVKLHFPVATRPAEDVSAARPAALTRGAGELVLLVEDEEGLRDVGQRILSSLGYTVDTAPSGEDALQMLDAGVSPAVLVTDVVMPGMTGPQLFRAVRERGLTFPVLFATGYAARDVLDEADDEVRVVEKPWTIEELASTLAEVLGRAAG